MIALKVLLGVLPFGLALVSCWGNYGEMYGAYFGEDHGGFYDGSEHEHIGRSYKAYSQDNDGNRNKRASLLVFSTLSESRTLDDLYRHALIENGTLVVYAGGDAPDEQESNKAKFEAAFPGVKVEIVVDLSKYHEARIDYQLETDTLVVDVAQLQTIQDFPRWKDEGVLFNYKPIGWDHIYDDLKDFEGAYTGVFVDAITTNINTKYLPNNSCWPVEANDFLKPEFRNKLVVTYPNEDDAVLFWFKQVVDKYGYGYLEKFKAQNPKFVRGTATAIGMVADSKGGYVATMSADGGLFTQHKYGSTLLELIQKDPSVIWAQTAAIFKKAKHPETAKLYISWLVDSTQQAQPATWSWSVRDDVSSSAPFKSVSSYPTALLSFMKDREEVEIFRTQVELVFGDVQGPNPNEVHEYLGTHPVIGYRPAHDQPKAFKNVATASASAAAHFSTNEHAHYEEYPDYTRDKKENNQYEKDAAYDGDAGYEEDYTYEEHNAYKADAAFERYDDGDAGFEEDYAYKEDTSYKDDAAYKEDYSYKEDAAYEEDYAHKEDYAYKEDTSYKDDAAYKEDYSYKEDAVTEEDYSYKEDAAYEEDTSYKDDAAYKEDYSYKEDQSYKEDYSYKEDAAYEEDEEYKEDAAYEEEEYEEDAAYEDYVEYEEY